jgi:DNA-directed RNA polymerase subunit N (RpoN/RPB10)
MESQSTRIFGGETVLLQETDRALTPFGGMVVFLEFLNKIGFVKKVTECMPVTHRSPNSIPPAQTYVAFLISVAAGARRFAQTSWLRGDRALHGLLGIDRFPSDDTIRNLFLRFGMGEVQRFFEPLTEWMMERLERPAEGHSLDLDSTVFERHGHQQEGALKGYNPRRPGRLSHHPLLAVLAEAHFVMHGWLRSGNCGTARGVTEFLKEVLALWGERGPLRVVRADAGFFDKELFAFLEQRRIDYIVVARFTKCVKREVTRIAQWRALDENYAVGECAIRLMGWDRARRFVAVRERVRDSRPSVGKKLIDLPEYTFRVLVTSLSAPTEEIWRDYNRRADMENRIAELKHDLGADRFCLRDFHATDAVFRSILLLFNLLSEFRRASGMPQHKEPGTLRSEVFLCGAELTHVGSEIVLLLSTGWGGLKRRISLLSSILTWVYPISPKLVLVAPA